MGADLLSGRGRVRARPGWRASWGSGRWVLSLRWLSITLLMNSFCIVLARGLSGNYKPAPRWQPTIVQTPLAIARFVTASRFPSAAVKSKLKWIASLCSFIRIPTLCLFLVETSRRSYQSCADAGRIWFNCCDVDLIGAVLFFRLIFSPAIAFQLIAPSEASLADVKWIWLPCQSPARKPPTFVNASTELDFLLLRSLNLCHMSFIQSWFIYVPRYCVLWLREVDVEALRTLGFLVMACNFKTCLQ